VSEINEVITKALNEICSEFTDITLPKHNKFVAEVIAHRISEHIGEVENNVKFTANLSKPTVNADISANFSLTDTFKAIVDNLPKK
jgi:hypothetical protein